MVVLRRKGMEVMVDVVVGVEGRRRWLEMEGFLAGNVAGAPPVVVAGWGAGHQMEEKKK